MLRGKLSVKLRDMKGEDAGFKPKKERNDVEERRM